MSTHPAATSRPGSPRAEPDVEVLLAEVVGGATLRLFIDHPDGVSLELCERVTHAAARRPRAVRARGLLARAASAR